MTRIVELVTEIERGPSGPAVGALFDLDGTLVSGYTAGAFYRERLRRAQIGPRELARSLAVVADSALLGGDPGRLGPIAVEALRGRRLEELEELGERLFREQLSGTIRPEARDLVRAHRRRGHTVAIASSATRFQVDPIARELGIEHVLCSEVDVQDGVLSGHFTEGMLWGDRKARAARAFATEHGLDLSGTYAYANGDEDVAFLSIAGRPHAVNPNHLLEQVARAERWPIMRLSEPGPEPGRAGVRAMLGTVAAVAGMNGALAAGLGVGLLSGNRRAGANVATSTAFGLALALAGVHLRVVGRENLSASRPAVFVFNHQSNLDPIVAGALVRRDFTATGKQEVRRDPAGALAAHVMDAVLLDRANPERAKAQINQLVDRLRDGESVLVAPEGTRRPELGEFKHGAFHVAMEAGAPIVPIVLRNTGELMGRGAKVIQPGVVDVCVLEPVSTDGWTREGLGARVDQVRERFSETLENWPEEVGS
jgi:putative phosphoserine phosphatase/1-acylglycerol-3-phosphate O-acyltransferase